MKYRVPDELYRSLYSRAGLGEPGRRGWLDPAAWGVPGCLRPLARSPSSAQSRAKRLPGRARQAIFEDLGSSLASVFDGAGDSTRCAHGRTLKTRELERTSLGRRFAREPRDRSSTFFIPCVSQPPFLPPRRAPRRSEALLLMPRGDLRDPLGAAGCVGDAPRRC